MDDRELGQLLVGRFGWGWWLAGGMLLSPDSQSIVSPRSAAELEGIDPDESYEIALQKTA